MATDDLCLLDLVEVGRRVQAGKLSSVEVTRALLDRIARHDSRLKSYATLTADLALAQAKQADAEIARGEIRGPLHGVPIAVKDLCNTKGIPTSAGMPICAAASCASQSLALPWGGASCVALRNPSDAGACSPRSTCIAWSSRIGGGAGRGIQPTTATLARVASSRLASASIAIQRVVDHRLLTAPVPQRRSDTLPRAVSARGLLPRTRPARACGAGG